MWKTLAAIASMADSWRASCAIGNFDRKASSVGRLAPERKMRWGGALLTGLVATVAIASLSCGPAMAQGDTRFCSTYGANMAGVVDLALKKNPACLDYAKGVHSNYQMHFDWCMKQPQASVQGAEANIRRLVTQCAGNGAQPSRAANSARPNKSALRFEGTWIWRDKSRGTLPATFELYPNRQGEGRYCYPARAGLQCFDIRYTIQGNAYVFTNNGVNWFSMTSPEPGAMTGRYWDRRADVNLPPSATISMRQTGGSRD
ncbi:MAG: hypothetical protein QM651_18545 [Rhodoblastus sp.]